MEAISISGNLAQPSGNAAAQRAMSAATAASGTSFAEVLTSSLRSATQAPVATAPQTESTKGIGNFLAKGAPKAPANTQPNQQTGDAANAALGGILLVAVAAVQAAMLMAGQPTEPQKSSSSVPADGGTANGPASTVADGLAPLPGNADANKIAMGNDATAAVADSPIFATNLAGAVVDSVANQVSAPVAENVVPKTDQKANVPQVTESTSGNLNPPMKAQGNVDPAVEALMLQAKSLQSESVATRFAVAQQPVVTTTVRDGAAKSCVSDLRGMPNGAAATLQSLMPRQELEQLRNGLAMKSAPIVSTAAVEKSAVAPSGEAQGRGGSGQQTPHHGADEAATANSSVGQDGAFSDAAAKALKQNAPAAPILDQTHDSNAATATPQVSVQQMVGLRAPGNTDSSAAQASATADTPNAGPNWRLPGDGTAQGVSTAQLADAATHTEMRIAMQTDKLGNIELRAHVSGETVAAAITVEKRDAHSILAGELPALQQALSEKSLRVDQVALFQGSLDLNHSQAGKDAEQQQAHSAQQQTKAWTMQSSNSSILSSEHLQTGSFDSTGRLNVQA